MVFAGYYKNPEATAQTIVHGWLHTGDVVREEGGQLKIVDRLKDIMITAGGKNITPSEIENTMKASPFIKECIIVADARKFVGALVMIDFETVGKWAEARRLAFTHFRSLVQTPEVRQLIDEEIARGNAHLAQVPSADERAGPRRRRSHRHDEGAPRQHLPGVCAGDRGDVSLTDAGAAPSYSSQMRLKRPSSKR